MFSSDESSDYGKEARIYAAKNDKGNFCRTCKEVFPDFLANLSHKCRPFKCKTCPMRFEHDYELRFHKKNCFLKNDENANVLIVQSSSNKLCECIDFKNMEKPNETSQSNLSCNGDKLSKNKTLTESNSDTLSPNEIFNITSKRKLDNIDHMDSKKRKVSSITKKTNISKVLEEKNATAAPECSNSSEINLRKNKDLKDACTVNVILSDTQKLPDSNLSKEAEAENTDKGSKMVKNSAKKLKVSLKSNSNVIFNSINASQSSRQKRLCQNKVTNDSNKCLKRKQTDIETPKGIADVDSQSLRKRKKGLLTAQSSRDPSPTKRKTRQMRSCSKEHDSGLELFETASSSSFSSSASMNSNASKSKNNNKNKKVLPPVPEMKKSAKVSHAQQQKGKKGKVTKKSTISDDSNALVPRENYTPLELVVSKSTLNDIPEDIDFHQVGYSAGKKCVKGKNNKYKTENYIELVDLLNALPHQSDILVKASPGSFHSYRCPKCNKLFKHLRAGLRHLGDCTVSKFKKTDMIALSDITYVCTVCRFHSTRNRDLTTHKDSCTSNSLTDILSNYMYAIKPFRCSKCTFSCLSQRVLSEHPCNQRLQHMQGCKVAVEKINPLDFKLSNATSLLLLDPAKFGVSANNLKNKSGSKTHYLSEMWKACSQNCKKTLIQNAKPCDTIYDVLKHIVSPLFCFNLNLEPDNSPDLDLDVTMPYENQKLLVELAERIIGEMNARDNMEEIFKIPISEIFDNDSIDAKLYPECDKILTILKNYKCGCKAKISNSEGEKKPCLPCLNAYIKKYVLSDIDLPTQNIPSTSAPSTSQVNNSSFQQGMDATPSTSAPSTSQVNNSSFQQEIDAAPSTSAPSTSQTNDYIQQEIDNMDVSFTDTLSSLFTSDFDSLINSNSDVSAENSSAATNGSTVSMSDNVNGPSKEHTSSSIISSDIYTALTDPEVPLEVALSIALSPDDVGALSSDIDPSVEIQSDAYELSNKAESTMSCNLELNVDVCNDAKQASEFLLNENCDDLFDAVESNCKDNVPSSSEHLFSSDVSSGDNANFDENLACVQPVILNSEQNQSELPDLFCSENETETIRKGEITIIVSDTECSAEVFKDEVKMSVTTDRIDVDLKCEMFHTFLLDLYAKLLKIISLEDNADILEETLNIIYDEELSVNISNKSVHLNIPFTFDPSLVYSVYILRDSSQNVCAECEEEISFKELIKHTIEDHKKNNICISVV